MNNNIKKIMGRPKKFERECYVASFYLPLSFKETWNKLSELAEKETDPNFKKYCLEIEEIDLEKKKQGIKGSYIRWILTNHVFKKLIAK